MGSITLEFNKNPAIASTQEVLDQELASLEGIIITMEATFSMEEMDTTTMVTSMEMAMAMAMEGMATSSISTLLHQ